MSESENKAAEAIRRVKSHHIDALRITIREVRAYHIGPTDKLRSDLDALVAHSDAVNAFAHRMKFGSATVNHAEEVIEWLIDQGWTPPAGVFLPAEEVGELEGEEPLGD